jgi:hypothetical protein
MARKPVPIEPSGWSSYSSRSRRDLCSGDGAGLRRRQLRPSTGRRPGSPPTYVAGSPVRRGTSAGMRPRRVLPKTAPVVLFACTHKRRAELAAALRARATGDRMTIASAGTAPTSGVDPVVLEALTEWASMPATPIASP